MAISSRLAHHLLLDIVLQIADRHYIVVNLFMLTGDEKHGHLVEHHDTWGHKLGFQDPVGHLLAHLEVEVVNHLNCKMNGLTSLSEFDSHFIDTIYNSLASLKESN